MKERIQKALGNAGVASRRNIEQLVREGRVAVNDKVVTDLPVLIDPEVDRVAVDGENIRLRTRRAAERIYLILNKPRGVYSTNVAQGAQVRAIDLLNNQIPQRVYPVGRLDADSKGLLLLTNDGDLANRLIHPRYGVPRTYRAVVDGNVALPALEQLRQGVYLMDVRSRRPKKTGRCEAQVVKRTPDKTILQITMREGVNRQIRRVLAKLGHKVRDLTRVRMGPLTLEGVPVGGFRPLTPRELSALKKLARAEPKTREE